MSRNVPIAIRKILLAAVLIFAVMVGFPSSVRADDTSAEFTLTSDEQTYLDSLGTIRVAVNDDFLPLEGYDTAAKTSVGFVVSLLNDLSSRTGVKFEYTKTDTLSDATQLLSEGAIDLFADYDTATQLLDAAQYSDVYLKASLLIVGNKNFKYSGQKIVIAVTERSEYLSDDLLAIYPNSEILLCQNARELFQSVQSGRADVLVRNVYSVQSELSGNYPDLAIIYDTGKLAQYRFAFSENTDARLIEIFNRYIASLTEAQKNQMLVTSTLSNLNSIDMNQTVRSLTAAVIIVSVFLLAFIVFVIQLRKKNRSIQEMLSQKKEYDEVISSRAVLEGMFDTVYEMDVTNNLAESPACLETKKRLGLPSECSFSTLAEAVTLNTVKEEYRTLHRDTFNRDNILKRFAEGDTTITIEGIRKQDFVHYVWNRITLCTYQSKATNSVKLILYVKNIQAEKEAEQKLINEANTDSMTGLNNKRPTQRLIDEILKRSYPSVDFHALLLMDVDNFKSINDTMGHAIGDEILKSIAGMIKSCFREGDVVSRIGGDEFLAFMQDCKTAETAGRRAKEILSLLNTAFESSRLSVTPTLSIGIALYPVHADNYNDLFALADSALYDAKKNGRNHYRVFSTTDGVKADLHISNKQLQEAILDSTDGVAKYALNRGFRIFSCTDRILNLMQITKADLPPSADTAEYVHPDDLDGLYESLRDAYEHRRKEPFTASYRIRKADRTYFKVRIRGFFTDEIYTDPESNQQYPIFYVIFTNLSDL